ncbi:MAG TPA: hypothetical protein DEF42_01520 [Desulfosporosinus sp.]|nr:hypothetical protein [Desulfosporosinus sp.]
MKKIKGLTCMALSAFFTLAFSATAFAAPAPTNVAPTLPTEVISKDTTVTPNFVSPNQPTGPGTCWVTASPYLNVRKFASTGAPIIGQLNYTSQVYVYEVYNGWATVQNIAGEQGFVTVEYLSTVKFF